MTFTVDHVNGLAPDAGSLAAAKKLTQPAVWRSSGRSDAALWGVCAGSADYQVRIDLTDLTAKCSCPSRKFPCKHALGLMLIAASQPDRIAPGTPPDWVTEWLDKRGRAAEQREQKQARRASAGEEGATPPADPAAQQKRAAQRLTRVRDGLDALDLWMNDLVRTGFASLPSAGSALWTDQAARLVDAQAPALASRIRDLRELPGSGADWPERLAGELGLVSLLTHAFRRLDQLDAPLQADVRSAIGWTLTEADVVAAGDLVEDDWIVIGQATEREDRIAVQRNWLTGARTRREALVLQFSANEASFGETFLPGTHGEAVLAFWPSATPRRALVQARKGPATAWSARLPGIDAIAALLSRVADDLSRQPWSRLLACVLHDMVPTQDGADWLLVDRTGAALPLEATHAWPLLALSGGQPIDVTTEWNGRTLRPLLATNRTDGHTWMRGAA